MTFIGIEQTSRSEEPSDTDRWRIPKGKVEFRKVQVDSPCAVTLPVTALVAAFATCFKALITSIAPVG